MRSIHKPVAAAVLAMVLLAGSAVGADPAIEITSPAPGAEISRTESPTLSVSGLALFDVPEPDARRYFLRRSQCASGNDDARLALAPGSGEQTGCLFIVQPLNEVYILTGDEGLATEYAAAEGGTFTLDASRPITGQIRLNSGVGAATLDLWLTGTSGTSADTIGTYTHSYTVTMNQVTVPFTITPAANLDKKDYSSLSLKVRVRGVNALHGAVVHNGQSWFDLPTWTASLNPRVEVSLNNPGFPSSTRKVAVLGDGGSWATPASSPYVTPAPGQHTLYARAIQGGTVTNATPVPFTVVP